MKKNYSLQYKYGTPNYNYLNYIRTPGDKGVSGNGTMGQLLKNTEALPYWIEVLTLGWGDTNSRNYKDGKGSYNISGKLGNKYRIQTGLCKDGKTPRWTWIDNVPNGKIPVFNPLSKSKITEIPTPFYGLVPGLIQDIGTVNPIALFEAVSGKGNMFGECFEDYTIKKYTNINFLIGILIIFLLIIYIKYTKDFYNFIKFK